ncbi:hypothetical protein HWV62_4563 [Athelia sp. TMB]|nr:hypothetical protein HWV62_4563 [Athelia sp. TMB]
MSGRGRKRPAFEWLSSGDTLGPAPVRFRHSDINVNVGGLSSVQSSSTTAPASPTRVQHERVYQEDYLLHQLGLNRDVEVDYGLGDGGGADGGGADGGGADGGGADGGGADGGGADGGGADTEGQEDAAEPAVDPKYQRHLDDNLLGPGVAGADKTRPKRVQVNPLRKWLGEREEFLLELLRRDGRGDAGRHCPLCKKLGKETEGNIRCIDCHGGQMLCQACVVLTHQHSPLHRIEKWNNNYFENTSLKKMGLTIQLGHPIGTSCTNPRPAPGDTFVILDITAIHDVALAFCACSTARSDTVQLLRAGFYPATTQAPETAATINALEHFQLLTFESKTSAFEYHNTLARMTDNTGTEDVPDRYEQLLCMIREWRNLKMLKRAGRGHDPAGVEATKEGEFLFSLFLGNDANFRMVRKKVSSEAADPTLSKGWSYFCEVTKYREHLATYGDQKEVHSTCVKHHAVNDANTGKFANLAASGVGTVDCARHMLKRPTSLGELQKGEKYANMDYLFFSSLSHPHDTVTYPTPPNTTTLVPAPLNVLTPHGPHPPPAHDGREDYVTIVASYDIACQWSIHLWDRMQGMPERLQIDREGKKFIFLVPKFHLKAHVEKCQTGYSFNFNPGVGRTDGEAPERGWSFINPLSSSTKEMGPASYRETIDDHFGDWNHKRVIGLGKLLVRRIQIAVPGRDDHVTDYLAFSESLPALSVLEWSDWVETWEKSPETRNPYVPTVKKVTQHDVRLALAGEDAKRLEADEVSIVHDDITPGLFIAQGIDIEAQQIRLKADKKELGATPTSLQLTKIQERQNSLSRKIKGWIAVQQLYMPEASPLRTAADRAHSSSSKSAKIEPSDMQLYLPSALPHRVRAQPLLYDYEFRLRIAQAYDTLESLRSHLRMRTHMYQYKDKNLRGQGACTRAHTILERVKKKSNACAAQYRRARAALVTLSERNGDNGWQASLKVLEEADIRSFTDDADGETQAERKKREKKQGKALGEGFRKISWIWMTVGVAADGQDEGLQEALRIQWCKARARATHWTEEVLLLREEMRRVLAFLTWHAGWWDCQASSRTGLTLEAAEGVAAYAHKQAAIRRKIHSSFDTLWVASWAKIKHGVGSDNEILDLGESSFVTSYPPPPPKPVPSQVASIPVPSIPQSSISAAS